VQATDVGVSPHADLCSNGCSAGAACVRGHLWVSHAISAADFAVVLPYNLIMQRAYPASAWLVHATIGMLLCGASLIVQYACMLQGFGKAAYPRVQ
jgi:hypothetical protein